MRKLDHAISQPSPSSWLLTTLFASASFIAVSLFSSIAPAASVESYREFQSSTEGGRYNSATDSWVATSLTGAPSGRSSHTAVWTGTEMIVWGGGVNTGGRFCASPQFFKEATLSPVVSGPTTGKAEILFVPLETGIQQQFSVKIERAVANNSYRILVEISSDEPMDLGNQLDFGFVETDREGNAAATWSSSPKNGERDIRPLLPPGKDVRNFLRVMVAHGGGTIIFLSGKF